MNSVFKKVIVSSLTLALVLGGSTAAFAKNKEDDHQNERRQVKWEQGSEQGNHQNNQDNEDHQNHQTGSNIQINLNFEDMKGQDVQWAMRYIASLASKRVFEGYEDGTFKPNNQISRIEAITAAVRLLGLRSEAEAKQGTKLYFSDAGKIQAAYPWATGYVAVAAEHALFMESDNAVQPDKSADRLWATILLVKALKLDGEAKAKMNADLTFKDADKIPAGARGYVAVAVEKGLIDGYEDNTFRPNAPLRRAELAALLDRTGDKMPEDKSLTKGTVISSVSGNVLTVNAGGASVALTLDVNTFVFSAGQKITVGDIKAGDQVKVRTYNNVIVFIEVVQPAAPAIAEFSVSGMYKLNTLNNQGALTTVTISQVVNTNNNTTVSDTTYTVASDVKIQGEGQLTLNRTVELKVTGTTVSTIILK